MAENAAPAKEDNSIVYGAAGEEYELLTNIKNFTKGTLQVLDTHFWHGRSDESGGFPPVKVNYEVGLTQVGTLPEGVKWGIVYADGTDSTARKFLVAVHGPANKIYAEAGPIGPVDWNVVEVKLDRHSGNKVDYKDPALGGSIEGEINETYAIATFYD